MVFLKSGELVREMQTSPRDSWEQGRLYLYREREGEIEDQPLPYT